MRGMLRIAAATAAMLMSVAASPAAAQFFVREAADGLPQIVAGGSASVAVQPDRATVYAALAARDSTSEGALAAASKARDRVTAALARAGVPASAVSPWGFSLGRGSGPECMPDCGATVAAQRAAAQRPVSARWGVRVVVDRLDRLDAVLAALAGAGVDGTPYVLFESQRHPEATAAALAQAVADARQQAEAMARAAGGRLGPLVSLSTFPESGTLGFGGAERFFFSGGFAQNAVAPSDVTVRAAVMGAWRFVPQ